MDKGSARKLALENRTTKNKEESSRSVVDKILSTHLLDSFSHIGIYYPIGNEIDITKLVLLYPEKNFYLPITKQELAFAKYSSSTILKKGPFHTMEPIADIVQRETIEVFLIPCVAINKDNQRIGYGKGYYDRYLAGYQGLKIGICYQEEYLMDITCNSYDVQLSKVIVG